MVKQVNEEGIAPVPANAMGGSSSTSATGGIDTYDKLLKKPKKKLREMIARKTLEDVRGSRS